jgi:hypothetical protein
MKVDGGSAIDVGEVLALAVEAGAERAGARSWFGVFFLKFVT